MFGTDNLGPVSQFDTGGFKTPNQTMNISCVVFRSHIVIGEKFEELK